MAYWVIVETPENWEFDKANKFRYFGLPEYKKNIVGKLRVGDLLVTYVTKVSCFADLREVVSTELLPLKGVRGYDSLFPFAIQTRPLIALPRDKWLKTADIKDKLEMTMHLSNWAIVFRQSTRQLSGKDGELLKRLLEERAQE